MVAYWVIAVGLLWAALALVAVAVVFKRGFTFLAWLAIPFAIGGVVCLILEKILPPVEVQLQSLIGILLIIGWAVGPVLSFVVLAYLFTGRRRLDE